MALTKIQIKFIEKNQKKLSIEKISKELNVPVEEIKKYIEWKSAQKAPFYFYIILVLIPIIFFVLLEVCLQIFHYGNDLSMWSSITEDKLILNSEVARRYFSTVKNVPTSIEDVFDKEKKPNSFRVFILGESSAAGYPFMPLGSFSRYIRKRLELAYPNNRIEIINIGLTAVNSYTIRDFIPGVLEEKPDLILIYTGHNEYYGALGIGSLESLGNSRTFVNLVLYLNKFKMTQLLKNFIQWFMELFSSTDANTKSGTLMSRMAKEQYIEFNSENYKLGISQFADNMRDVIEMVKKSNVPIMIGTLTSNLKDQKPFISVKNGKYPPAEQIFDEAQTNYNLGKYKNADSLFRLAKDFDELRFRAPEEINKTIKKFGKEYNIPILDVDSVFNASSPNGIIGNNLMTDHLHPSLKGYQLMGKLFFEEMARMKYLPQNVAPSIPFDKQDSTTLANFPFFKIDSTISIYRIKYLKNDWPYIDPKNKINAYILLSPKTFEDSLAFKVVAEGLSWAECHEKVVERCIKERKIDEFLQEIEILLYQYPIIVDYYKFIDGFALDFMNRKDFNNAYKILSKRYQIQPNDFSTKWLGTIDLNQSRIKSAIRYLEQSYSFNSNDNQMIYNLAGAYALNKDYSKSYDMITKVMNSDPYYPGAQNLLQQLKTVLKIN